jgi:ATP-dependent exoDNAse (exonuclease V) beta subunit
MASTSVFDRLDPDQKEAVALRKNGAVSAGAGSGKTTVLAARYLDLVFRDGADVSSILCLTFTRKAQAEMQARVYRELCASSEPRARAQVERFAEASISTLDSFSSAVLRSSAQDYGFAPNFRVDDQACRDLAVSEALRFLLARREEAPLAELFARMGFETAWKGLFAEAAYRFATPANRSEGDFASMPARAEKAIVAALGRAKGELGAAVDQVETALETGEATTAKGKEAVALLRALPASLISGPSELTSIKNVGEPDLTVLAADCAGLAALDLRAFGRSETEKAIKEAATAAREAARRIADLARAAALLPLEREILGRLAAFAEEYREAKRRSGVMGFHDVAVCAIDLLARRKELRAYWKSRFRFIMVDEFQDDN